MLNHNQQRITWAATYLDRAKRANDTFRYMRWILKDKQIPDTPKMVDIRDRMYMYLDVAHNLTKV